MWVGNSQKLCPGVCAYPFAVPDYIPGLKPLKSPNGDMGVDGMVSVIGHEIAELATNPFLNAWYGSAHGQDPSLKLEIADLCEGIYGTGGGGSYTGKLLNGEDGAAFNMNGVRRRFLVQWVWNRLDNYCSGPNALDQSGNNFTIGQSPDSPSSLLFFVYLGVFFLFVLLFCCFC